MPRTPPIIDTNITLGQWPTRRVPCDKLEALIAKLRAHNVTRAWTSHFDALSHTDLTEVNNRLAAACARVPLAQPVLPSNDQKPPQSEPSPNQLAPTQRATAGSPRSATSRPQLIP